MAEKVKSLAGTGVKYVRIQGRIKGGLLHIQGEGVEINRHYGVAVNITVTDDVAGWITQQKHTLSSLVESSAKYVPLQAKIASSNLPVVHVQGAGSEFNREYGIAFDVISDELYDFVKEELDKNE